MLIRILDSKMEAVQLTVLSIYDHILVKESIIYIYCRTI